MESALARSDSTTLRLVWNASDRTAPGWMWIRPEYTTREASLSAPLYRRLLVPWGAAWSWSERWSKCWVPSVKYTPSISLLAPGSARTASTSVRDSEAPKETASDRRSASRPRLARWMARWLTPSPQSWSE